MSDRERQILYDIAFYAESKKYSKPENITRKKQTHWYREQISGYQWGEAEKAMAPHSSTLAWKIPWMEEPGGLQPMGLLRVRYDWPTSLSLFTFMHWRRKWQPTPVFLPGGMGEPGGLPTMELHRVGHDWSDLAAAAAMGREEVAGAIQR